MIINNKMTSALKSNEFLNLISKSRDRGLSLVSQLQKAKKIAIKGKILAKEEKKDINTENLNKENHEYVIKDENTDGSADISSHHQEINSINTPAPEQDMIINISTQINTNPTAEESKNVCEDFDSLSEIEKIKFRQFCWDILMEQEAKIPQIQKKRGFFDSLRKLMGCLSKQEPAVSLKLAPLVEEVIVGSFVLELGNFLKENCTDKEWAFRLSPTSNNYNIYANNIDKNENYDIKSETFTTNASTYKAYVREVMGGFVDKRIMDLLIYDSRCKCKSSVDRKLILSVIPFILGKDLRRLLKQFLEIFRTVIANEKVTRMNSLFLSNVLGPTFLVYPDIKDPTISLYFSEIVREMLELEYNTIPTELLTAFKQSSN